MRNRFVGLFALSVALMLVSAACSVNSVQDEGIVFPGAATAAAEEASLSPDGERVVTVSLTEFAIEMSQTEFEVGVEYVFEVTNNGSVPHELMFIHPMELETPPSMAEVDEMAVAVFSVDDLAPGATVVGTVSFDTPGVDGLESACYVPGHHEAGMELPITVTG